MSDAPLDVATLDGAAAAAQARASRHVTLTVLAHPDAARVGERAQLPQLAHARARAAVSRAEPAFRTPGLKPAPLLSAFVSRKPLWIEGLGGGEVALDASESGSSVELDGAPLTGRVVLDGARLDGGLVLLLGSHVALLLHREAPAEPTSEAHALVGDSEGVRALRAAIGRVGAGSGAVLVRGETGSGKELVAAALHKASPRRAGPFVAVNMAAIPSTLAASELFGHARGAFSGADKAHDGFLVRADGGTLFLDEVADTPSEVQAALLRALESGEVQALGTRTVRTVDVRVVAATDADLERAVADGRFRAPLLYRLSASEVRVPPLRERRADIGRLVVHFLRAELAALGREALLAPGPEAAPWLPAALVARLARYDWPGNVRQLRSVCHALALAGGAGAPLASSDEEIARLLPAVVVPAAAGAPPASAVARPAPRPAKSIGDDELERVLVSLDYRLGAAAEALGISRPTMNELVDRHPRLRRAQRLDADEITRALDEAERTGRPAWRMLAVSERGLLRRMKELGLA